MWDCLSDFFTCMQDAEKRNALMTIYTLLGGIGSVVIAFLGWLLFRKKPSGPQPAKPSASTGDINIGDGASANINVGANITTGITLTEHEQSLRCREAELEAQFKAASDQERTLAQKELATVRAKLKNTQASFAETERELKALEKQLRDIALDVTPARMKQAEDALKKGDRTLADALLRDVEEAEHDNIKRAAKAAYTRGEIAEQEIRWRDAAAHFHRASQLDPSFDNLKHSWKFYWRMGEKQAALAQAEELIKAALKDYGEDSPEHGLAQSFKASTYGNMGRLEDAEPLHLAAIGIAEKTKGKTHPDTAIELNNYAQVLDVMGRHDEANGFYKRAIAIVKNLPDKHIDYARYLNNLSDSYYRQERYEDALKGFEEADAIFQAELAPGHPEHSFTLNNRAEALAQLGRVDEAEALYHDALKLLTETVGAEHDATVKVQANYDLFKENRTA